VISDIPPGHRLEAVNVFLKKNRCDSILFRVRLYALDEDSDPEELLHYQDILHQIGGQKKWVRIDLEAYGIRILGARVLVTLEALASWGNNTERPDFSLAYDKDIGCCAKLRQYSKVVGWLSYALKGGGLAFNFELRE